MKNKKFTTYAVLGVVLFFLFRKTEEQKRKENLQKNMQVIHPERSQDLYDHIQDELLEYPNMREFNERKFESK